MLELVLELEFARGEHLRVPCRSLEIRPVWRAMLSLSVLKRLGSKLQIVDQPRATFTIHAAMRRAQRHQIARGRVCRDMQIAALAHGQIVGPQPLARISAMAWLPARQTAALSRCIGQCLERPRHGPYALLVAQVAAA